MVLATLPEASIDACVTDPPYELGFMGKAWDRSGIAFDPTFWAEVLRVLKPGAHLLACGGTRTYHRMGSAIEDAGFDVRDCLAWLYGSGFPKSLNLGEGLGTALKPAYEPIVMARKPLKGTVKGNVERFGTGALNVDACRIGDEGGTAGATKGEAVVNCYGKNLNGSFGKVVPGLGRWPSNVTLDEYAALVLDEQSGDCKAGGSLNGTEPSRPAKNTYGEYNDQREWDSYADNGGASRFFYVAKPSREERDFGCDGLQARSGGEVTERTDGSAGLNSPRAGSGRTGGSRNFHPTVKPVELMRWLVRLVTPVDGVVLDPFLGSGTTGMAAKYEQRRFIGIEREPDYLAIAERRIAAVTPLFAGVSSAPDAVDPQAAHQPEPSTRDMFSDQDVA